MHFTTSFSQGTSSKTRWHWEIHRVGDVNRCIGTYVASVDARVGSAESSALRIRTSGSVEDPEQRAQPPRATGSAKASHGKIQERARSAFFLPVMEVRSSLGM